MITEKQIKQIIEADKSRTEAGLGKELLYSELKFAIESLLDNKVSEGRKS